MTLARTTGAMPEVASGPSDLIDYDHAANHHTLVSPEVVLPRLFQGRMHRSLLDVGCGIGTWLKVARDCGIADVAGVDGVSLPAADLLVPAGIVRVMDLRFPWTLRRTFDVALCLEVAEHLDEAAGGLLVEMLTRHTDEVVFSAACPGQPGQHHINCQWPEYWQGFFNAQGFVCSDDIRWSIWDEHSVDVWYRQNMFVATRNVALAGSEPRLKAVIHPEFVEHFAFAAATEGIRRHVQDLENGAMPLDWYARSAVKALSAKLRRRRLRTGVSEPTR